MKLWTIQPVSWYNALLERGVMTGNIDYIDPSYLFAYHWLVEQMEARIGRKSEGVCYPVWAWYQYRHAGKRKPDLRNNGYEKKGEQCVLLEIEKATAEVLLSDFHLWHYPLGLPYYIGDTEEDSVQFESELEKLGYDTCLSPNLPLTYQEKIRESWNKIFNMNFDDPYFTKPFPEKSIQATF